MDDVMIDGPVRQPTQSTKKTEMIEVRVSYETKRDFLNACQRVGRTASDVIRESIQSFVDEQSRPANEIEKKRPVLMMIPKPIRRKRYLAVGAGVAGLALLAALPSAAAPDPQAAFRKIDANGDGVLSASEFSGSRPAEMRQMEVQTVKRGAARASGDAYVFILPQESGNKASDYWRDATHQRFTADGKLPLTMAEKRTLDFSNYDTDGDGGVTYGEYQVRLRTMAANGFRKLDRDGNGALDATEYAALAEPVLILPPDANTLLPTTVKYGSAVTASTLEASLEKLDADKDGKLSLKEYLPLE